MDAAHWVAMNQPFNGVKEALMCCEFPFYILTTKDAIFAGKILCDVLGLNIPADSPRLIASRSPPAEAKAAALRSV